MSSPAKIYKILLEYILGKDWNKIGTKAAESDSKKERVGIMAVSSKKNLAWTDSEKMDYAV